jgi:hypothetical protein
LTCEALNMACVPQDSTWAMENFTLMALQIP